MEKKKQELQITELYLVKPAMDWSRTYMGTIKREVDVNGNPILYGSVVIQEGRISCKAGTEDELSQCLDEMALLKLDYNLHENPAITAKIIETDFSLN